MASSKAGFHQKDDGTLVVFDQVATAKYLKTGAAENSLGGLDLDQANDGLPAIGDLTDLGTAEDETADWLLIYDTNTATWKKVLTREFPQLPNYTALGSGLVNTDLLHLWWPSGGYNVGITLQNFMEANGPTRAYRNGNVTAGGTGARKVSLNAESYDVRSWFDSSTNFRFQPSVAGYYQFNGHVTINSFETGHYTSMLYKNGAVHSRGSTASAQSTASAEIGTSISDIIYMNGSSDYVELWCDMAVNRNFVGTSEKTYLSVSRIG